MAFPTTAVIVLGMHRGGTSATTRVVNLLGVPLGDADDRMPPRDENPRGYWESERLRALNDELLENLDGHWTAPPPADACHDAGERLAARRERAAAALRAVYSTGRFVWKDPRLCITLPFWLPLLGSRPVFVFAQRNPLEIARSLAARGRFSKLYSLALWERYVRSALDEIGGRPAFVVRYVDLLHERSATASALGAFLAEYDAIEESPAPPGELDAEIDVRLRHHAEAASSLEEDRDASRQQKDLYEIVERLAGAHGAIATAALPNETPWAAELIEERRELVREERRHDHERRRIESLERELGRLSALVEERDDLIREQEARLDRFRQSVAGRLARKIVR